MMTRRDDVGNVMFEFYCPGCRRDHSVRVQRGPGEKNGSLHSWNRSLYLPTIRPHVVTVVTGADGQELCHAMITNGSIQFASGCTHFLAGKAVPLLRGR